MTGGTLIDLQMEGDNCWPDLKGKAVLSVELRAVALLPDAEARNALTGEIRRVPSLTLRLELPTGQVALAQVKVDMMQAIMGAVKGRLEFLADLKARGGVDS